MKQWHSSCTCCMTKPATARKYLGRHGRHVVSSPRRKGHRRENVHCRGWERSRSDRQPENFGRHTMKLHDKLVQDLQVRGHHTGIMLGVAKPQQQRPYGQSSGPNDPGIAHKMSYGRGSPAAYLLPTGVPWYPTALQTQQKDPPGRNPLTRRPHRGAFPPALVVLAKTTNQQEPPPAQAPYHLAQGATDKREPNHPRKVERPEEKTSEPEEARRP